MRPAELTWKNVRRYKGEHAVRFESGVYAVTAQHANDSGRSNWCGKTTFLELVALLIYGWHSSPTDDSLITYGEDEWAVAGVLTDGTEISRTHPRSATTRLVVTLPGGKKLTQSAAQAALVKHIGLSCDDFMATCFVRQKMVSSFITARNSGRNAVVDGWLGEDVDPLIRCLARVHRGIASVGQRRNVADKRRAELQLTLDGQASNVEQTIVTLEKERQVLTTKIEAASTKEAEQKALANAATRFQLVVNEGKALRKEMDSTPAINGGYVVEQRRVLYAQFDVALQLAERELRSAQELNLGSWTGECPLVHKPCPSNAWVLKNSNDADKVRKLSDVCANHREAKARALDAYNEACQAHTAGLDRARRLERLREERDRLLPDYKRYVEQRDDGADTAPNVAGMLSRLSEVGRQLAELKTSQKVSALTAKELSAVSADLADADAELKVLNDAARVLVQAKRKVAEQALQTVERGANARLKEIGVDLSVRLRWERPGSGIADVCDQCGEAYTRSTKVKSCPVCAAPRGKKMLQGFHVELSDTSGAAEDLAGLAICITASEWLRARRGSQWSMLELDEPFGSLDATNRKALSVHIANILSSFDLALVVAHHRSVLDMLPLKVKILADERWSKIET